MSKNRESDNIVFDDIANRIVVEISPDATPQKQNFSKDNFELAELLTSLKSFNKSILEVRQQIGLDKPLPYPKSPTIENVVELFFNKSITDEARGILKNWAKELREKYRLSENWGISFRIAVLTNILPAPPSETVGIHLPKNLSPNKKEALVGLAMGKVNEGKVLEYPAIYFTRQFSIDELKRWINDNKSLVRALQSKLPKERRLRRKHHTLFWGQMAWMYKKNGMKSWTHMSKKLQELLDSKQKDNENNNEDFPGDNAPEPGELRKHYVRFIRFLRELESS